MGLTELYLPIRLRARDFYEVVDDEGDLVESDIKHRILHKNIEKCARKMIVLLQRVE